MQDPRLDEKLNQIRSLAEEHFDDFMIVVMKDGEVHDTYSSRVTAMGMCKMVEQDINKSWGKWSDHRESDESDTQGV